MARNTLTLAIQRADGIHPHRLPPVFYRLVHPTSNWLPSTYHSTHPHRCDTINDAKAAVLWPPWKNRLVDLCHGTGLTTSKRHSVASAHDYTYSAHCLRESEIHEINTCMRQYNRNPVYAEQFVGITWVMVALHRSPIRGHVNRTSRRRYFQAPRQLAPAHRLPECSAAQWI